jgi:ribosome-associated protein
MAIRRTLLLIGALLLAGTSSVSSFVVVAPGTKQSSTSSGVRNSSFRATSTTATTLFAEQQQSSPRILCDLQTFLRLTECVSTGGEAKTVIQAGNCILNGEVETRRAKKLFDGDMVTFADVTLSVADKIKEKGYVYKVKAKKVKPVARVDADGNKEFGGRYRSDEWRAERKQKKSERKENKE